MAAAAIRKFRLRTRFMLGTGIMLLPLLVLAATIFFSMRNINRAFQDVVEETLVEKEPIVRLQLLVHEAIFPPHRYALSGDLRERQTFARLAERIDRAITEAGQLPFSLEEERGSYLLARQEWTKLRRIGDAILAVPAPVGNPAVLEKMGDFRRHSTRLIEELEWIHEIGTVEIEDQVALTRHLEGRVLVLIGGTFLAGILIALASAIVLARSVLLPMRELDVGARQFAEGNLDFRLTRTSGDEIDALKQTFNAMADSLAKSQEALREMTIRDPLTGLFNHREFFRLLAEELERSRRYHRPLALLMLDLDFFKRINDTYGHPAGDEVLRALPELIRQQLRKVDLPCRYGGEEFSVLLPETAGPQAMEVAERIRRAVAGSRVECADGTAIRISVSVGVAAFPESADAEERLVWAADNALYVAKRTGRNRTCLAADLDAGEDAPPRCRE